MSREVSYENMKALEEKNENLEAEVKELVKALDQNWVQHQRVVKAETERNRYRSALERILCQPRSYGADMLEIAREAFKDA